MEELISKQQQNAETMQKVGALMAERLNALATRQMEMAQKNVNDMVEGMKSLSTTKNGEEYIKNHSQMVQKSAQQMQDNARELADIISSTQTEAMTLLQKQFKDNWETVAKQVQDAQVKLAKK